MIMIIILNFGLARTVPKKLSITQNDSIARTVPNFVNITQIKFFEGSVKNCPDKSCPPLLTTPSKQVIL